MATESTPCWLETRSVDLFLTGFLLLLQLQASAVGKAPQTSAGSEGHGSLVVFPEGSGLSEVVGYVCVMREGKLLQSQISGFNVPVVFENVPAGKVSVVISPEPGRPRYARGEAVAVISPGEQAKIRLQIKSLKATSLKLRILGLDGQPLTNHGVVLRDTTAKGLDKTWFTTTNDQGVVSYNVCRGQTYVASVRLVRSGVFTLRSDPIQPQNDTEEVEWALNTQFLKITLVRNSDDGTVHPARDIKRVRVRVDGEKSTVVTVNDGVIELCKEAPLLRGAEQAKIELINRPGKAERALDPKDGIVRVSEGKDQEATLSIVPEKAAEVTFKSPKAKAYAYMPYNFMGERHFSRVPAGRTTKLSYGSRDVYWVAPGAVVAHDKLDISSREPRVITHRVTPAKSVSGKLYTAAGEPVKDASVAVRYLELSKLPVIQVDRTDRDGAFEFSLNGERPVAVAFESRLGGKVVIASPEHEGVLNVRLAKPVRVEGQIKLPPSVARLNIDHDIIWYEAAHPEMRVAKSEVEDGKFAAVLQPGEYKMSLFHLSHIVEIGEATIDVGDSRLQLETIDVSDAMWEAKRPAQSRFLQCR